MTAIRDELMRRLWHGRDPFAAFPEGVFATDLQGWGHDHPYLVDFIDGGGPLVVVEIGVWKGASTIAMARRMQERGVDGVVIAIDTWLGAADHWVLTEWFAHLGWDHGYPMLQRKFMANVVAAGLQDRVLPFPIDSLNAAGVLRYYGIGIDAIHLDAGHDYPSVAADLRVWWPLLKPGGLLIGDDYHETNWPGVRKAFDDFFAPLGLAPIVHSENKCRLRKPAA